MSSKKLLIILMGIFFFIPATLFPAAISNATTNSSSESEVEASSTNRGKNIIFDSYDEVNLQNFDKEDLTQIKFIGNVKIRFEDNMIKARTVIITSKSNKVTDITAYDNVEFRYSGQIYLADFMSFNPDTKMGILRNVRSYVTGSDLSGSGTGSLHISAGGGGWYYHADKVTILSEKRCVMEKVSVTFTPSEYPAYQFYAERLWYFKDDLIYAFDISYTVGEGMFFYFPFFLRWERRTGIRTAFGQEERIGYYLMNTLNIDDLLDGYWTVGLDFYERLGQYLLLNYGLKKPAGILQSLNINFQGANDVRTFYDTANDRYTHISPDSLETNITQLSYDYTINGTVKLNDLMATVNWEDLNDPFFVYKYSSLRRYDFNLQDVFQPQQNQFYSHDDSSIVKSSITRSLDLKYNVLDINGSWIYQICPNQNVSNIYLNSRYNYFLTNITFPTITFSPPSIDIIKSNNYSYPASKTIEFDNKNYVIPLDADPAAFIDKVRAESSSSSSSSANFSSSVSGIPNNPVLSSESSTELITAGYSGIPPYYELLSAGTNLSGTGIASSNVYYKLSTNNFEVYNFSMSGSGNFNYTTMEFIDTNSIPTYNHYQHQETIAVQANLSFLNRILYWTNTFSLNNIKQWSMFDPITNNIDASGTELDYGTMAGIAQNPSIFTGTPYQINFPYNFYYTLTYPLFDSFNSLLINSPPQDYHNFWLKTGFNFLQNNVSYNLSLNYYLTYGIGNNVPDYYIDNLMDRRFSINTSFAFYWLTLSTGTTLDLLETNGNYITWNYDSITNHILPGQSPMLTVQFSPPDAFSPLPSITYVYDILQNSNVTLDIRSSYKIQDMYSPYLYKLEALTFAATLHWDFESPRNTFFDFTINSTIWLDRYWSLNFSTEIKNTRIFRYFQENAQYLEPGETIEQFWPNTLEGFNILDINSLEDCFFKIQDLHFSVVHYLNEWVMDINFDLFRRVDQVRLIAFWEPSLSIEFKLNGSDTYPAYQKKFVPPQYQ